MTTASILRPGDVLSGFRVEELIGVGGTAIVYRAEQLSLGRPVALKVLSDQVASDDAFRERFRREGKHLAALEHPNIVPVHDSGESEGLLYLAMRLVDGTTLAEIIHRRGLTADRVIEILRPIANALDVAHADELIHRDVKPQNILVTERGHPYLADFGVAKGSNTFGLTATGGFVGSVNYASPEQILGSTLTSASDIYALTAVLYHCLSGNVPYRRESDAALMQAHLHDPAPTLVGCDGDDEELNAVIARGMTKDPDARYENAQELLQAAARAVAHMPPTRRDAIPAFPLDRSDEHTSRRLEGQARRPPVSTDSYTAGATATDRRRPTNAAAVAKTQSTRQWRVVAVLVVGLAIMIAAIALIALTGKGGRTAAEHHETLDLTTGLAPAFTPRAQLQGRSTHDVRSLADAEARLAAGDTRAVGYLARLSPGTSVRRLSIASLTGSLRREAAVMRALAAAARREDREPYTHALHAMPAAQASLGKALGSVEASGFTTPKLLPIASHRLALPPAPKRRASHRGASSHTKTSAPYSTPAAATSAPVSTSTSTPEPTHESQPAPVVNHTESSPSQGGSSPHYGPTVVSPPVG